MLGRGTLIGVSLLGVSLSGVFACGSDDGSSVEGSKKMSELTETEAKQLCKDHQSEFDAIVGISCEIQGLTAADKAACVTSRDQCVASSPSGVDCNDANTTDLVGCDLEVSVVASCLKEVSTWVSKITCDKFDDRASIGDPPACYQNLQDNCPLFGK